MQKYCLVILKWLWLWHCTMWHTYILFFLMLLNGISGVGSDLWWLMWQWWQDHRLLHHLIPTPQPNLCQPHEIKARKFFQGRQRFAENCFVPPWYVLENTSPDTNLTTKHLSTPWNWIWGKLLFKLRQGSAKNLTNKPTPGNQSFWYEDGTESSYFFSLGPRVYHLLIQETQSSRTCHLP